MNDRTDEPSTEFAPAAQSACFNRRQAMLLGATAAVAVPLLAACGSDDGGDSDAPASPTVQQGEEIGAVADVPVGGCAVYSSARVVLTQPTEGDVKAFSAVCTHAKCLVNSDDSGVIPCSCHGSEFSLTDGSVVKGPATVALAEVAITVKDGKVFSA